MTTARQLHRQIDKLAERITPAGTVENERLTDTQWLAIFERMLTETGITEAEPVFRVAVQAFRDAISTTPPADSPPPAWYCPYLDADIREGRWQNYGRLRVQSDAWVWCSEIIQRWHAGTPPPVTEAEFHALALWFFRNEMQLHRVCEAGGGLIDTGGGGKESITNIKYNLMYHGARDAGAGVLAEKLRYLRSQHPTLA